MCVVKFSGLEEEENEGESLLMGRRNMDIGCMC
jgi:hypothetical protein